MGVMADVFQLTPSRHSLLASETEGWTCHI